jgi:hypothetical protein
MNDKRVFATLGFVFCFFVSANGQGWDEAKKEKSPSLRILSQTGGDAQPWKSASSISPLSMETVRLKTEPIADADEIRWFQIIPDTSKYYKNANHPWEENAYKWVGFGKIDYVVKELTELRGKPSIDPLTAAAQHKMRLYQGELGSFWFQVQVRKATKILRSPGIEDNDSRNLRPSVFRITVRSSGEYLGHLTGFFNVPGVFGSIPYQCSNYIGIDCADVLVTAYNKWKEKPNTKDYNVDMLVSQWPKVTRAEISGGKPAEELKWSADVKLGDLIAVKYSGRKRYQHIGALYKDADSDGLLGPGDHVIHAGPEALHVTALSRGSFDGDVVILRPK